MSTTGIECRIRRSDVGRAFRSPPSRSALDPRGSGARPGPHAFERQSRVAQPLRPHSFMFQNGPRIGLSSTGPRIVSLQSEDVRERVERERRPCSRRGRVGLLAGRRPHLLVEARVDGLAAAGRASGTFDPLPVLAGELVRRRRDVLRAEERAEARLEAWSAPGRRGRPGSRPAAASRRKVAGLLVRRSSSRSRPPRPAPAGSARSAHGACCRPWC